MLLTRSHLTRALHLSLLLVVLHQLLSSLVMERPFPGDEPGWPFFLHQWLGLTGLGVITLFWLWALLRDSSETPLPRLLPWFSRQRMADILEEIARVGRDAVARRAPSFELDALASAIHGLGLLLVSFVALTGAVWFFLLAGTPYARVMMRLHSLAGTVMWAYLVGHALMAIVRQLAGDEVFSRMFWFRRRSRRLTAPAE